MTQNIIYDEATLVHVKAWYRQAASHYHGQRWTSITLANVEPILGHHMASPGHTE